MTEIDAMLAVSAEDPDPRGDLPAEPQRKVAVVTCMDARLDPPRDLGIEVGDAHIIRNAGGRVTDDVLRSLLVSWHVLGTREVLIVHHTSCGGQADDEAALRAALSDAAGVPLDDIDLHTFEDHDAALRADLAAVRRARFAPKGLVVRAALHDLDQGRVIEFASDE